MNATTNVSVFQARLCWGCFAVLTALFCSPPHAAGQYDANIGRWTAQDALDPPASGAILFVGSSSIRRWEQLTLDFADYKVIQRGFGGAHFDHVNIYVNDIVLPYNPAAIVVWAGTNDIASGGDGNEVFADYLEFVTTVHAAQPDVDIFYLGIMPTPGRFANGPEEMIANNAIAGFAAGNPRLHYIDLPTPFWAMNPPSDPAFTGLFVDSIHLNRQGYEFWTSIIRPGIEAVIAPNKVATANPSTPPVGGRILFDFGPSNSDDGDQTASPDAYGNHWNNWHPAEGGVAILAGEHLGNMVDATGTATGIGLTITGGFSSNGKLNGGLLAPDPGLLGDLAIGSATEDYFYCSADGQPGLGDDDLPGGFMIDGLDPDLAYDFRFFGSRTSTESRATKYQVIGANQATAILMTSGTDIGHGGVYDGNDDTFASVAGIRPDAFGQIFVDLTLLLGSYAYVNAMDIIVRQPGDWDHDGEVNIADAVAFVGCLAGPNQSPSVTNCRVVFDFNFDYDVDLRDFAEFQSLFAAP
ncbi:MAG: hypothetical protein JXB13_19705 [Phycisphaerae bacterium]|nr:hypothetical protein [Phycisphaerae bacterium]